MRVTKWQEWPSTASPGWSEPARLSESVQSVLPRIRGHLVWVRIVSNFAALEISHGAREGVLCVRPRQLVSG